MTWLFSATTHFCLNRMRNHASRRRLLDRSAATSVQTTAGNAEPFARVRQLLARLPDEQSAAAVYHYVDEMTQDEIAQVMGCSRRHVGHLLERVRERMKAEQACS